MKNPDAKINFHSNASELAEQERDEEVLRTPHQNAETQRLRLLLLANRAHRQNRLENPE